MQPQNTVVPESNQPKTANTVVGQTWSNAGAINIDLDNLMSGKSKSSGPALSMNQLKMQSPVKSAPAPLQPSSLHINNNNNNNFNSNLFGSVMSPTSTALHSNSIPNNFQQSQQPQLFGNLMSTKTNSNNLNNQFNAFQ